MTTCHADFSSLSSGLTAKPGSFIDPFRCPPLKGPFDDILPPPRRGPGQMKPLPLAPGVRMPATWRTPLPPI